MAVFPGKTVPFFKMQGCGNDFVVIDNRELKVPESAMADWARAICRRAFGVGADGLFFLETSTAPEGADYRWHFYNSDGSRAEMCGNASRCAAVLAPMLGMAPVEHVLSTDAGLVPAVAYPDACQAKVRLPRPHSQALNAHLDVNGQTMAVHFVNTGVPHAVVFPADTGGAPQDFDVKTNGAAIRYHQHFAPKGTNANFAWITGPDAVSLRTYERGVEDETYACGTGAAATAVVAHALGLTGPVVNVTTTGGETLTIHLQDGEAYLQGSAILVFTGELNLAAVGLG